MTAVMDLHPTTRPHCCQWQPRGWRYSPAPGPGLDLFSNVYTASPHPTSGNTSCTSPEALGGVCRRDLNLHDHNHSALLSASREPENRAEKRGDSHRFWFFGEELFFAEKWCVVGESGLAPRCTGKPMNRADNFNEPAPAVAIRPDHYVFHTIAEVAT